MDSQAESGPSMYVDHDKYDDLDGHDTHDTYDVHYHELIEFIEKNKYVHPNSEDMYKRVMEWLETNWVTTLTFGIRSELDYFFNGKGGGLNMDAFGRPCEGDIIEVSGTNMVVTNASMFTFDVREYNEKNERVFKFISGLKEENPATSSEEMYQMVDAYMQENEITGLTFGFRSFLDFHFYGKGGGLNMDPYGRPQEGNIIKVHNTDFVVESVGMFTFDIQEYQ